MIYGTGTALERRILVAGLTSMVHVERVFCHVHGCLLRWWLLRVRRSGLSCVLSDFYVSSFHPAVPKGVTRNRDRVDRLGVVMAVRENGVLWPLDEGAAELLWCTVDHSAACRGFSASTSRFRPAALCLTCRAYGSAMRPGVLRLTPATHEKPC
jgi:hypothetical protein